MLDPSKDKYAYFKNNIQTSEDQEDFDASQYYYNRRETPLYPQQSPQSGGALNMAMGVTLPLTAGAGTSSASVSSSGGGNGLMALSPNLNMLNGSTAAAATTTTSASSSSSNLNPAMTNATIDSITAQYKGGNFPGIPTGDLNMNPSMNNMAGSNGGGSSGPVTAPNPSSPHISEFPALSTRVGNMSLESNVPPPPIPMHELLSNSSMSHPHPPPPSYQKQQQQLSPASTTPLPPAPHHPSLAASLSTGSVPANSVGGSNSNSSIAMMTSEEFIIQKEDFPALSMGSISNTVDGSPSSGPVPSTGLARRHSLQEQSSLSSNGTTPELINDKKESEDENNVKYGLLGLLSVIRMQNKDLSHLSIGPDLTSLGLNLNSTENLYPTFASPWSEKPCQKNSLDDFRLPSCYYKQPPVLKLSHFAKFNHESCFYIFYAMPQDIMQAYAAQELYRRNWLYHKELQLWFIKSELFNSTIANTNSNPGDVDKNKSLKKSSDSNEDSSEYLYFDTHSWESKKYSNNSTSLELGFLKEDEVQVQVQPQQPQQPQQQQ